VSADWWRKSLRAHPLARLLGNWTGPLVWTGATLGASGCAEIWAENEPDQAQAALDAQRESGWSVGDEGQPLAFPGAQPADITGGAGWRDALTTLAARLTPAQVAWQPYYAPTLFQSLEAFRSADLRAAIRPVFTSEMAIASRRGEALLSVFLDKGACRSDVALVLDVPGPEAVALAAALAPCFEPVFVFDNWPHPNGIVPAHLTLGAALYFLPELERARAGRAPVAPPMFVLDRQRLLPYDDDSEQFDNRYFTGLPSREALQAAGIRHLLYVTVDETTVDADDLNGDLVALDQGGVDVKMLALSDFSETPLPGWLDVPTPCPPATFAGAGPHYYFGGSAATQGCFAWWYGWNLQLPGGGGGRPIVVSSSRYAPLPPSLAPRCRFHPTLRAAPPIATGGMRGPPGWHPGGWHPTGHWTNTASGFHGGSMGRAGGGFSGHGGFGG
jgi:hypothetical protein